MPLPAQRAAIAGQRLPDLHYDKGHIMNPAEAIATVPIIVRPGDTAAPGMSEGFMLRPAKEMEAVTATTTLRRSIEALKQWTLDFPYPTDGENASVLHFMQVLRSRQQARLDASAYGGTPPEDPEAYVPTPAGRLEDLRDWFNDVLEIYDRALKAGGLGLAPSDQSRVTALRTAIAIFDV